MRCRLTLPLMLAAALLITALSTGSAPVLMGGVLVVVLILFSLVSVLLAVRTLQVELRLPQLSVHRGSDVSLQIAVSCRSPLPVAPIQVHLQTTPDTPPSILHMVKQSGSRQKTSAVIHAGHVGVSRPGVTCCVVEDLFGIFSVRHEPRLTGQELVVLPQTFDVAELTYAHGESGMETLSRATEDITDPADVRAYAPGDPMKKIHWKLSLRKRELLVRRFEEPALPDALLLMDCAPPSGATQEEAADLRDALLETAASLMAKPQNGHTLRLPLMGAHPVQVLSTMGLPLIMENLARADFNETDQFERVLMLQSRRMSRVGCCVVMTSRLSGALVEAITRIRRMGPVVRVYLITADPESERNLRYVHRLQRASCEVSYVTPAPM